MIMSFPIKTLLVDDQESFREAMHTLLGLENTIDVVAEASNGEEALCLAREHRPHVVLMDLRMPVMDGVEATRRIRAVQPDVRVLVLSTFDQDEDVFDALRAGASGYVLKNIPPVQLVDAIRVVASGETYLQPSVASHVVAELNRLSQACASGNGDRHAVNLLSHREHDILRHLVRGMSNKEIATALCITEGTVKNHMSSVLEKLQVHDRTAAALKARDIGLV